VYSVSRKRETGGKEEFYRTLPLCQGLDTSNNKEGAGAKMQEEAVRKGKKKAVPMPPPADTPEQQNSVPMVVDIESSDADESLTTTSVVLSSDEELQIGEMLSPIHQRLQVGVKILLAVIWVRADEQRLFELFPEVFMLDVTFGTNSEHRPLAVSAAFDSFLKTFTPIRAFLPSECQWVFQWIWETAIPALLGTHQSYPACTDRR
jgi:hypothetical protein